MTMIRIHVAPAVWLLAAAVLAANVGAAGVTAEPAPAALTAEEFDALHERLTRMAGERVWSIPWKLSVREARQAAAEQDKPIFLWISNNGGTHPLGPC